MLSHVRAMHGRKLIIASLLLSISISTAYSQNTSSGNSGKPRASRPAGAVRPGGGGRGNRPALTPEQRKKWDERRKTLRSGATNAAAEEQQTPDPAAPPTGNDALPVNPEGAGAIAAPVANPNLQIEVGPEGVRVFAMKIDAAQVFIELGLRTGTKIVVDDTVNRQITAQIRAKTVAEVIDAITGVYGLSSAQVDGAFLISEGIPKSPSSYLLSDIDTITTKYVLASNAKSLLPVFLQDHVKINQEQNAVVLSGPREVLRKFREDIAQFDVPAAQIMLETLMVEMTDTSNRTLSTLLGYTNGSDGATTDPLSGTVSYQSVANLPTDFNVRLNSLVEKGQARIRANPHIATVSGQTANIFIGRQRFLSTPVEVRNRDTNRTDQINYIDAGIRLIVTPFTGGQGEIIVDVQPEISFFGALDPVTHLPDKATRRAQTVMRVHDGETIIIGGLTQLEERTDRSKIPFLGDLPIIGSLFRGSRRQHSSTQLAIFVTPRILSNTGHLPDAHEEQKFLEQFGIKPGESTAPALSPDSSAPSGSPQK